MKNRICFFGALVVLVVIFLPSFSRLHDLKKKIIDTDKEIQRLKSENARLREEKRRLVEDPVYLESVAREKLGIVREGEMIYRMND